jgi:hypothetical protein
MKVMGVLTLIGCVSVPISLTGSVQRRVCAQWCQRSGPGRWYRPSRPDRRVWRHICLGATKAQSRSVTVTPSMKPWPRFGGAFFAQSQSIG